MSDYSIVMPWPPSLNGYWKPYKNRLIISKRGREYRKLGIQYLTDMGLDNEKIDRPIRVDLLLNPKTLRKYDIDNFTKCLFDVFTHAKFWIDDSLVEKMWTEKGEKVKEGNVIVTVNYINK